MRSQGRHVRALLVQDDGAIGVATAILLPVMLVILGLVLDISYGYASRSQLQSTADASVLAGALSLGQGDTSVVQSATDMAKLNMPVDRYGTVLEDADVQIGSWDSATQVFTPGAGQRSAVQVVTRRSANNANALSTFFAQMAGLSSLDVNTRAVAGFQGGGLCFLTLKGPTPKNLQDYGVKITGTSNVNLKCGIGANLNAPQGVTREGNATVDAAIVTSVGGINPSNGWGSAVLAPNSVKQIDPYANVNPPTTGFPGTPCPILQLNSHTPQNGLSAGQSLPMTGASLGYTCLGGIHISSSASLTLPAGVYVIDGYGNNGSNAGALNVDGNLTCSGCTFVLTNRSATGSIGGISISSSSTVNLTAPTTGTYKRLVIYQDRRYTGTDTVNGGSSSSITGAFYFPNALLKYTGNASAKTDCFQAVVSVLEFAGTVDVADTCPAGFGDLGNKLIRLVG